MKMAKSLGYICGVLDGDGYIDDYSKNPRICLSTTNPYFANKFARVLEELKLVPRLTERIRHNTWGKYSYTSHFFNTRATVKPEFIALLNTVKQEIQSNYGSMSLPYLEGFYDSEGYHQTTQKHHTISMSNCDITKLHTAQSILRRFGIYANIVGKGKCKYLNIQRDSAVMKFQRLIGNKAIVDLNYKTKGKKKPVADGKQITLIDSGKSSRSEK
jgi:hypothetical protein